MSTTYTFKHLEKPSKMSAESVPLLGAQLVNGEYPRISRRRILRDCSAVLVMILLAAVVILIVSIKKPTQDANLLQDIRDLYNPPPPRTSCWGASKW